MPESGRPETTPAVQPGPHRLHVVLWQPEIASNVGNIGRTCVAAGAMLWMVRPLGFHLSDRHLKRAGLDYWPHLSWRAVDSLAEVNPSIPRERFWFFSTKGDRLHTDAEFLPGDILVFGPESRGLPADLLSTHSDRVLRIPIRPEARSLNLACSVSVGLFEAVRQLDSLSPPSSTPPPPHFGVF